MFGSDSRILVVEYFCAGGGAGGVESALLPEARTMAAAVLEDFARLPGVRVLTLHRPEIPFHLPAPHEARAVGRSGFGAAFGRALRTCDAALVVAPERGRILERLTRSIECAGVVNLGASSAAVRIASDKWSTYRVLARAGVPQPPTICIAACGTVDPELVKRRLNRGASTLVVERRRPSLRRSRWILKPLDGYACLGLRAVDAGSDLGAAMRGVRTQTRRARILLQQECSGVDASVSLIGDGRHAVPICLNRQIISREGTFEYSGGVVPLEHHLRGRAFEVARAVARAIPGLCGYFGVDLILGRNEAWVVDVNPRLTTAYVGLRRVARDNPARWIEDAAFRGRLPRRIGLRGRARFSLSCASSSVGTLAAST